MNRDDIIRMAREAEICTWTVPPQQVVERYERFAALVIQRKALDQVTALGQYEQGFEDGAAAEREECAKVCDARMKKHQDNYGGFIGQSTQIAEARECAAAIRARGSND